LAQASAEKLSVDRNVVVRKPPERDLGLFGIKGLTEEPSTSINNLHHLSSL
jgi:hypothetical protein